jgi:hypothetical protein
MRMMVRDHDPQGGLLPQAGYSARVLAHWRVFQSYDTMGYDRQNGSVRAHRTQGRAIAVSWGTGRPKQGRRPGA